MLKKFDLFNQSQPFSPALVIRILVVLVFLLGLAAGYFHTVSDSQARQIERLKQQVESKQEN